MQLLKFTSNPSERPRITQGVHIGTLIQIIDIGIQPEYVYDGKIIAAAPKVILNFEFPNFKDPQGSPMTQLFELFFTIYVSSTLYLYANALLGGTEEATKSLQQGLNFSDLLGKSAQLQIGKAKGEKGTPKIIAMMPLPAGIPHPKSSITPAFFDVDNPDMALFGTFLPWVQKKIANAKNASELLKSFNQKKETFEKVSVAMEPNAENF